MKTLSLDISFSRDYYTRHFGIQYERDYFDDVRVRTENDQAAKRWLCRRFSDIGLGDADPEPVVQLGYDDTLNTTLMFGGELRIGGGVSWVEPGFLSADVVDSLTCPAVDGTSVHRRLLEQYERSVRLYGRNAVRPPVPHGILEAALDLRSTDMLTDMMENAQRADHLLDVLTEAVIRAKEFWDLMCYGEVRKGLSLGGCSTTMLSAAQVSRFLVERYSRIGSRFGDAFICCCGVGTQNLENYHAVEGVRYVRVGWGTDLSAAAQVLADRHIKAGLDVVRAATLSPEEIRRDVCAVLEALQSVDHVSVLLIHAGADTPEENVRAIATEVSEFAERQDIQLGTAWGRARPNSVYGGEDGT